MSAVVVTGLGAVSPFGPGVKAFDALDEGLLRTVGGVLYGAIKKEAFVNAIQHIRATLETHFSPRVVDKRETAERAR